MTFLIVGILLGADREPTEHYDLSTALVSSSVNVDTPPLRLVVRGEQTAIGIHPDGCSVTTGSQNVIRVWDIETRAEVRRRYPRALATGTSACAAERN